MGGLRAPARPEGGVPRLRPAAAARRPPRLQVPNLRSIQSRLARQEDIPRHLHFFTEETLRRFGEAAGIALERVVQTTDLFGGSGKGVYRLWFVARRGPFDRRLLRDVQDPRRERFRRWPVLAPASTVVGSRATCDQRSPRARGPDQRSGGCVLQQAHSSTPRAGRGCLTVCGIGVTIDLEGNGRAEPWASVCCATAVPTGKA